jgi:murein DD-endopeptidase MepM/ murein hydrolase activator NlpD
MNPVAALVLPVAALVLAGTTISTPPDHRGPSRSSMVRAAPSPSTASGASGVSVQLVPSPVPILRPVGASESPALRGRWAWPLRPQPAVVRPFLRPATKYGAGHRGVDLAGSSGQEVLAVEAGTVTHVGRIAGRGTVTVLHPSGIRSTYEPVDPTVSTGSPVARGAVLGRLAASGSHCAPGICLHLGAVRGDVYLDPMVFLTGGRRVRLLPLAQAPQGGAGGLVPEGQAPEGQAPEG